MKQFQPLAQALGLLGALELQGKIFQLDGLIRAKSYDSGINHWDTADVYGDGISEKIIGEAWKDISRSSIFLATKVGWDMGEYDYFYHPKLIKKNIDRSFNNLKTDYIDLFYLHH